VTERRQERVRAERAGRGRACRRMPQLAAAALLIALCFLVTACGDRKKATTFTVYYLNSKGSGIVSTEYSTETESAVGRVDELITRLSQAGEETGWVAPISGFSLEKTDLSESGTLTLYFSKDYNDQEVVREALARTAIVCTLGEVEGVQEVQIRAGDEPICDENGTKIGAMKPTDFIFNTGTEMRGYEKVRVHLYFADEEGKALVNTWRNVFYNSNFPRERMIVEQVLLGTDSEYAHPTLNPETKIISVQTRGDICYVNLDKGFLEQPYDVTPAVAIYSLVDSLTELPSVTQVQITVEGEQKTVFMDSVSLNTTFRRDLTLVKGTVGSTITSDSEEDGEE